MKSKNHELMKSKNHEILKSENMENLSVKVEYYKFLYF